MRPNGFVAAALLAFAFSGHLLAQSARAVPMTDRLDETAAAGGFAGAVVVSKSGQVLLTKGYGFADHSAKRPITSSTRFRIASLTKPIMATAVMLLETRGALSLSARLDAYLGDLPDAWRPLTIHQLLTHTAGLVQPNAAARAPLADLADRSPLTAAFQFRDRPMVAAPSEKYFYSALGYTLLAAIVEKVSGRSFNSFLRAEVFEPLNMNDTGPSERETRPSLAVGYRRTGDVLEPTAPDFQFVGAGHLYSTIDDLRRWDEALWAGRVVPRASIEKMLTQVRPDVGYGYGFNITTVDGRRMVGHGGSTDGFTATFERYPDHELTVIALSNVGGTNVHAKALELAKIALGD
jgi:CubicO group peptidase (beta-lactamase class C family)